jgi:peptide/nickel transport system substrate-binding protein
VRANKALRSPRVAATTLALVLVVGACSTNGTDTKSSPPSVEQATEGGTLVLGAAQEPNCADWYASCGNSSWGLDTMGYQTLPQPMSFVEGQFRPSPLLAGEPTLEVGPPQRVTFRIDPRAVWSDGRPITSSDFRYTVEQAKTGLVLGLAAVASVDDTDPRTAIVTYNDPDPAWRGAFSRGILPKHLLEGKDRSAEMRDGYRFSGGPWLIDHWTKGQEIKLVPNTAYWDKKPHLDAVVFKIIPDAPAYLAAYKTGQLDMIFVQGAQPEVAELKNIPNTRFDVSLGITFEFVLFNNQKPPVDSRSVRQALAYASDRDAIVAQVSGNLMPGLRAAQGFLSPGNRHWYTEPFKRYGRDLAKVAQLMTGDGWSRGPDGVWAKGGTRAVIELNTHTGNRRRELTQQILQSQWKEAGFETTVNNAPFATVSSEWLPKGTFQAAIIGVAPPTTDPNRCQTFCSKNIPTEANRFQGSNVSRISSKAIDDAWEAVARELDDTKRVELHRRAQEVLADEVPALPLSGGLDVIVSNDAKVGGPVQVSAGAAFSRLSEWFCKACR